MCGSCAWASEMLHLSLTAVLLKLFKITIKKAVEPAEVAVACGLRQLTLI